MVKADNFMFFINFYYSIKGSHELPRKVIDRIEKRVSIESGTKFEEILKNSLKVNGKDEAQLTRITSVIKVD